MNVHSNKKTRNNAKSKMRPNERNAIIQERRSAPTTKRQRKMKQNSNRAVRREEQRQQHVANRKQKKYSDKIAIVDGDSDSTLDKRSIDASTGSTENSNDKKKQRSEAIIEELMLLAPSNDDIISAYIDKLRDDTRNGKVFVFDEFGVKYKLNEHILEDMFYDDDSGWYYFAPNRADITDFACNMVAEKHDELADSSKYDMAMLRKAMRRRIKRSHAKTIRNTVRSTISFDDWISLLSENEAYKDMVEKYAGALREVKAYELRAYHRSSNEHRRFILDIGPTNSGKTHAGIQELESAESGVYLGPLRLLAVETAEKLNRDGVPCSILTGEESKDVPGARHVASTVEMLDANTRYDVAVIDECQMITDSERGHAWASAIARVNADTIHICAAPESELILEKILEGMNEEYEIVEHERLVPLQVSKPVQTVYGIHKGDALITFSRKSVQSNAWNLRQCGISTSMVYGALPYDVRMEEVRKFAEGETDVIVATDAIGMGMNLPIKRIIFLEMEKYDGHSKRDLKSEEIKQIAGRAGRYGIYDIGYVTATSSHDVKILEQALNDETHYVDEIRMDMPRSIVSLDYPLAMIMRAWQRVEAQRPYVKRDLKQQIRLARRIQDLPNDYAMEAVSIPFCSNQYDLPDIWEAGVRSYAKTGSYRPFLYPVNEYDNLRDLEDAAKVADLAYGMSKRYGTSADIARINEERKRISEIMIKDLSIRDQAA